MTVVQPEREPIDPAEIQRLQHVDLRGAERLALAWFAQLDLDVTDLRLTPRATSLNSFNGFAKIDGQQVFFKSHTEPGGSIDEYYNTEILQQAGYNSVSPLRTVREAGKQIVFYPIVDLPVMFDLVRQITLGEPTDVTQAQIISAEEAECKKLLDIYISTTKKSTAAENAAAPVHQLFWHRLTGGRLQRFYGSADLIFPDGRAIPFAELLQMSWTINGIDQPRTLGQLLDDALEVLDPRQQTLTVIGHGDAHFGNVFLQDQKDYLYFDPAFAGRHSPLLDIAKPLFHNIFAQWMYFPKEAESDLSMVVRQSGNDIDIEYTSDLPSLRQRLLDVKRGSLIQPLIEWLKAEGALDRGLRPLTLALMCCPLLTMNLADKDRFSPPIAWLGLAMSVQMGNWDTEQRMPSSGGDPAAISLMG